MNIFYGWGSGCRLEAEAAELAEAERAAKDAAERAEALARARALLQEEANIQAAKVQKEMAELVRLRCLRVQVLFRASVQSCNSKGFGRWTWVSRG